MIHFQKFLPLLDLYVNEREYPWYGDVRYA